MEEELYTQLKSMYPTPFDQKFSHETKKVDPTDIACLYCSRPAKVGAVLDNTRLKWKIDNDDDQKGCLQSFHRKEGTGILSRDCFVSWNGYKSILHGGQLGLTFAKGDARVEGIDINNAPFIFLKDVLIEGNWPGFIVMQTP